jgi:predicted CXXCH cytochrome family protein
MPQPRDFRPNRRTPLRPLAWSAGGFLGLCIMAISPTLLRPAERAAADHIIPVGFPQPGDSEAFGTANDARCVQCHQFDHGMSHPVNVRPTGSVPASLPLESGVVTCSTCHEATPDHATRRQRVGVRVSGASLCIQCHQDASPHTASIHASTTGRAHLSPQRVMGATPRARGLDSETRSCVACHDGAAGSDMGSHPVRAGGMGEGADHPMGVPMIPGARSQEGDFRMARVLNPRIRLVEGVVGCGSCHSVYSREADQLVMSNRGSRLCLSCHTQ